MKKIFKSFLVILFCLFVIIQCQKEPKSNAEMLNELLTGNEEATILVTDSGLGGLSIAADLAHRLPQSGVFRKARIVFFSALFKERSGYNSLKNEAEKVRIFDICDVSAQFGQLIIFSKQWFTHNKTKQGDINEKQEGNFT